MANRDYDRDYDRRESSRSRLFESLEETPQERPSREPLDRGYRRPYVERAPIADEYPRRALREEPAMDYSGNGNVTITTPKSYFDVQDMIESLRRNESIIVNLEGLEQESAQRILDFLSGASYALGGSMRRVKEMHSTFLVTPHGTGITDTDDARDLR